MRISIRQYEARRDLTTDAAIASLRHGARFPSVGAWLRQFGDAGLYERVRANLLSVGVLSRRPRWLRADAYPPVDPVWTVRTRARIRSALDGREQPDPQCAALCGLVEALGLHQVLSLEESAKQVRHGLRVVASAHLPPVRYVIGCVGGAVGDPAPAVYS
jgi:hypothetical protein